MIIESVNGEARQVFDFSKPDAPAKFYAPVRIGAGYRKRIELAKTKGFVSDGTMAQVIAIYAKKNAKPRGLLQSAWDEQIQMEAAEAIQAGVQDGIASGNAANADLYVLETLLTPAHESLSVKRWYDEFAEESEVVEVLNFSMGLAISKIETEPLAPTSGKATKRRAKADQ